MAYFSHNLKEGEEVAVMLRQHSVTFLKPLLITVLILIWPLYFYYFFLSSFTGTVIFLIWLVVGGIYFFYQWFVWYFDVFIITNQRVIDIDQRAVFSRKVSEVYLTNIQDVNYQVKGFWATLFNFGTVTIHSAGMGKAADLTKIANPDKIQELIVELQQLAKRKVAGANTSVTAAPGDKKDLSAKELIELITANKENVAKAVREKEQSQHGKEASPAAPQDLAPRKKEKVTKAVKPEKTAKEKKGEGEAAQKEGN